MNALVLHSGKWIYAHLLPQAHHRKTPRYEVRTSDTHFVLGTLEWYSPWRKFSFFPTENTVFEDQCLATIQGWLRILNSAHKQQILDRKEGKYENH